MNHSTRIDDRPAFQFYIKDWLGEASLHLCSYAARGLWIEMLCHMWRFARRGYWAMNGRGLTPEESSKLLALPSTAYQELLAELKQNGVCSETAEGIIYSRRMAREEDIRQQKARAGSLGGLARAKHANQAKGGSPDPAPVPVPSSLPCSHPPRGDVNVEVKAKPRKRKTIGNPDIKTFIDWWFKAFKNKTGASYAVTDKDMGIIRRLLGTYALAKLQEYAGRFINTPDDFAQKAGLTLGVFASQVNKIISACADDPYFDGYTLTAEQLAYADEIEKRPETKAQDAREKLLAIKLAEREKARREGGE